MRLIPERLRWPAAFSGWPVRWRVAGASAALTFLILVVFAVVIGRLTTDRIENDFHEDVQNSAQTLAGKTALGLAGGQPVIESSTSMQDFALANDAAIRIVDHLGNPIASTGGTETLGPPVDGYQELGNLHVATVPIESSIYPAFIQYARSAEDMDATIGRLWLFLLAGVLGGTLLATVAGLAVADRALRPVADLTATAREIATTGDASKRIPETKTEDEVAELAETLSEMLRSLDRAHGEREDALKRQREFLADASHELRTPLTSVLANLELLAEELEPGSERAEMVDSALNSSRRMRRLVSDLLLLARADAGRVSPRSECDLAEIASAAAAEVRPLAGDRALDEAIDRPLPVDCNPDEMHRLVVNLLDNAVRHTPAGSRIEVRARAEGDRVDLSVSDDGPGLPQGMEQEVFERFVRGTGPADTAGDTGTGLGLAIVRAVAEAHGGSAAAGRSHAGGARFTVTVPLAKGTRKRMADPVAV